MASGGALDGLDAEDVRVALDELLAWEPLRRSPQLAAFLRYIVDARLRGDESSLKAYSIAVDVLGRGEDFDPQTDPIVRVQARRLRSLMATFYASGYSRAAIQIDLPVGRYVPEFKSRIEQRAELNNADSESDAGVGLSQREGEPPRNIWIVGMIAVCVLGAALFFWPSFSERTAGFGIAPQPAMPLVIIEEFENLVADQQGTPLVAGLAVELVTDFNQFSDVSARYGGVQAALSPAEMALNTPTFLLSGVARRVALGVQYGVVLKEARSGDAIADIDIVVPMENGQPASSIDDIARYIVMRLGSPRSVLHANARVWLGENTDVSLTLYPCLVAFSLYIERYSQSELSRALECAQELSSEHADAAAIAAIILADIGWLDGVQTDSGKEYLERASAMAQSARDRDPTNSLVWMAQGRVAYFSGDGQQARDRFNSAYQLNPAGVDTVASYAHVLGMIGNWPASIRLSDEILEAETNPPAWYYLTPALYALRSGDHGRAIEYARISLAIYPEMSSAILVAAAGYRGDTQVINTYLPRLLSSQRYRRMGILPTLRYLISDPELLRQLSNGILLAGVPLDRLARPF